MEQKNNRKGKWTAKELVDRNKEAGREVTVVKNGRSGRINVGDIDINGTLSSTFY